MIAPWAREEVAAADLKDERLNKRLARVLSDLAERPTASLPAACGGEAELAAAYRFFDNEKVTCQGVLEPHREATRERIASQEVVLLVQDTTELDLTRPQQQVEGAGPMDSAERRGAFLHLMEAFTVDGTPLGAVAAEMWSRDDESFSEPQETKRQQRKARPIEQKESFRWLKFLRQARGLAQEFPKVRCVCVGDSEADIYHLFAEPRGEHPVEWLIRACQERCVCDESGQPGTTIREELMKSPVLFSKEISIRGRQAKTSCETRARRTSRKSRKTVAEVRAARITLRPPAQSDRPLPPVSVQAVLVREAAPPEGEEPVEWILLTTLPIDNAEQVREIIQYYCVRWMIEVSQPHCDSSAAVYQVAA